MNKTDNASSPSWIDRCYFDTNNQRQQISDNTLQRLSAALGQPPAQSGDVPLPAVRVLNQTTTEPLSLLIVGKGDYHWYFTSEQGEKSEGDISAGQTLTLPASLKPGYHSLTLSQTLGRQWHCRVIVAPPRCYQPAALINGQKLWGACIQLYTLRSLNNWGIGDFGDLQKMLRDVVRCGLSFVGLNPLHALYPAHPDNASPYSPSSRRWLNIIYIDVNAVEDFQLNAEAEKWWTQAATRQRLNKVRDQEWVDYPAVMALKLEALAIAWRKFIQRDSRDPLLCEFHQFVRQGGDSLYWYAVHDALNQWMVKEFDTTSNWSTWPVSYQRHDGVKVENFCRQHSGDIDFHCWLQWLAQRQLSACHKVCQQLGIPVGIYRDLAVGEAKYGATTWHDRSLYCMEASIGAPADPLGPQGQNWQLSPINPHRLIQCAYQPFIDLLRANMQDCGALRIDHVMSLMRLWWVPDGCDAADGGYVNYPLDDLLAILVLESQRNQCMIIGEDLGTVPPQLREKLAARGVYSYRVLYFETVPAAVNRADIEPSQPLDNKKAKNTQPQPVQQLSQQRFSQQPLQKQMLPLPQQWPVQSLATINTHDLPTLRSYWELDDLRLGRELGLYPSVSQFHSLSEQRQQHKEAIIDSLYRDHCLIQRNSHQAQWNGKKVKNTPPGLHTTLTPVLRKAIYRYIANCNSALVGVQPEDWLDMLLPVNIPGTSDQYANWRRKLPRTLEEIFTDPTILRIFSIINRYRKQGSSK